MLPFWIVDADLRKGPLSLIRQKERPLFSKVDVISRKSSHIPRPVAAFIDLAQKYKCRRPRLTSRLTGWPGGGTRRGFTRTTSFDIEPREGRRAAGKLVELRDGIPG